VVLADTEDVWDSIFRVNGGTYEKPRLVLFTNEVQSACGYAGSATGPFYCSEDAKVYIDLGFLEELQHRLGAGGDFAQADFFAGVWAHHAERMKRILEDGDLDEAINVAGAVGDDRIQMQSQGYVVPDSFTHGTSEQRKHWFILGYETGDLTPGDTFAGPNL
jgi:predicted metalloprotease